MVLETRLNIAFEFIASHSLAAREVPHPHRWKLSVQVSGVAKNGMLINLPDLSTVIEAEVLPLKNVFLNECNLISEDAQKFPTCETLSEHFFRALSQKIESNFLKENGTLKLRKVTVSLFEMDGTEWGSASQVLQG